MAVGFVTRIEAFGRTILAVLSQRETGSKGESMDLKKLDKAPDEAYTADAY